MIAHPHDPRPVDSLGSLRKRVDRLLKDPVRNCDSKVTSLVCPDLLKEPTRRWNVSVHMFLDFIGHRVTNGRLFLFGGILRDLALFGKRGFNSDIDLVVTQGWNECESYLLSRGAKRNKFGGLRFVIANRPIDIWSAQETWAIRKGLVEFRSVESLTETTVFNWDSILMNWTSRTFSARHTYLDDIRERRLDIVLASNPNPLGTAVRAFRYICIKSAREVSPAAAEYIADFARTYPLEEILRSELMSYGDSVIKPAVYRFFKELRSYDLVKVQTDSSSIADEILNHGLRRE
jgi:hypothetical protein